MPRRWCALALAVALHAYVLATPLAHVYAQSAFDDLFAPPSEGPALELLPPISDQPHEIAHLAAGASPRGGASSFGVPVVPGGALAEQAPRLNGLLASGALPGGAVGNSSVNSAPVSGVPSASSVMPMRDTPLR